MPTLQDTLGKNLIILYLQCSFWPFPMQREGFGRAVFQEYLLHSSVVCVPHAPLVFTGCPACQDTVGLVIPAIILHQLLCHYGGCQPLGHQLQM